MYQTKLNDRRYNEHETKHDCIVVVVYYSAKNSLGATVTDIYVALFYGTPIFNMVDYYNTLIERVYGQQKQIYYAYQFEALTLAVDEDIY